MEKNVISAKMKYLIVRIWQLLLFPGARLYVERVNWTKTSKLKKLVLSTMSALNIKIQYSLTDFCCFKN